MSSYHNIRVVNHLFQIILTLPSTTLSGRHIDQSKAEELVLVESCIQKVAKGSTKILVATVKR